jgi:aspartyl-tRNA(Asn)/glutamyl-tRNA(Gln) amidotransferase subunit A
MAELLRQPSVGDIVDAVATGAQSAEAVAKTALAQIDAQNGRLGAFLTVAPELALEQARAVDAKRARGEPLGPLAGVPIGLKDSLCTKDQPTTAGSRILTAGGMDGPGSQDPLRPYQPPYDAQVVALLRRADAVLPGKCNMDELAMGSSTENSAFRITRNPADQSRTPGGSSGGSAVAVAAAMTPAALGSDTGGSVRQPASFTGTVGIKPSFGRISRHGLIAFASSLDQVGVLSSDVDGAARILEVIAGHDEKDATSLDAPVPRYPQVCGRNSAGLRLGVPEEYFAEGLAPEVEQQVRVTIAELGRLGVTTTPIVLPHTHAAVATYVILATAECSSNLARFDGVRYGLRSPTGDDIHELYSTTRSAGFGAEVKRRIMLGTYVLSAGYYEAYYQRAQRVRTLITRDFADAFRQVDAIATPVSPTVAFELGSRTHDPLAMYLADVYTVPASLAGLPALSVPCGVSRAHPPP